MEHPRFKSGGIRILKKTLANYMHYTKNFQHRMEHWRREESNCSKSSSSNTSGESLFKVFVRNISVYKSLLQYVGYWFDNGVIGL